jgi:hypothetical protein
MEGKCSITMCASARIEVSTALNLMGCDAE